MTSFLANQVGGVFTPLVAKDKGDISNRAKCSGAQLVNNAQMVVGDAVVLGGSAAVAKSAKNGGKLAKLIENGVSKFGRAIKQIGNKIYLKTLSKSKLTPKNTFAKLYKNSLQDIGAKIQKLPGNVKVAAAILAVAAPVLTYIHGRHLFRQGQIDQKYTDRAKVENHSKNILD